VSTATDFEIIRRGGGSEEMLSRLQVFLEKYAGAVRRISLQRTEPHLILRIDLPPLRQEKADDFFTDLKIWLQG
jgi:hypothetical protein